MSAKMDRIIRDLAASIRSSDKKKTTAYDTEAGVRRIDGNTAWVHIDGGVDETPVKLTINAHVGDSVQVRVANGRAWIAGNASNPPTDDRTAVSAREAAFTAKSAADEAQGVATIAQGTAATAKETAEAILIYDHDYTLTTDEGRLVAEFHARLYRGGVDIHTHYPPELFTWYLKTEDGTIYLGDGYSITVNTSACGYGAEIIGKFTDTEDSELLTSVGDNLTNNEGYNYTVRANGDSVRVSDLEVATALYPTEKLMVAGNEDEHLVTIQALQDYLNLHLDKQVLFNTTAGWSSQTTLVSDANTLYVYTDHDRDSQGNAVAGIKAGDGLAYVVDLPFTDAIATEHIADTTRHITAAERTAWNNHIANDAIHVTAAEKAAWNEKVRCYYAGTEQLVFTTA